MPADLIIDKVSVITMNPKQPFASGVAIANGKFIGLLDENNTWPLTSNGQYIDGKGMTLLPGFIDTHFHLKGVISKNFSVSCDSSSVKSIADIIRLLKKQSESLLDDTWIRAINYDVFHLDENRHPSRWDLDKASMLHPIRLRHVTRHASVLNSFALTKAGIDAKSIDPPGITIERDSVSNEPTGLIHGGDAWLSKDVIPPLTIDELNFGATKLQKNLLSQGIVAICDATPTNTTFDLQFWSSQIENSWVIPIQFMTNINNYKHMKIFSKKLSYNAAHLLEMGPIKVVMESVPETHPTLNELTEIAMHATKSDIPLAIHVVEPEMIFNGFEAIRQAMNKYPNKHLRHRFEHLSLCPEAFLPEIAELGISVVTNPPLIYDHGDRYLHDVESSMHEWLYRMNSVVESDILLAAGSDAPIANFNPWIGIKTICTRLTASGETLGLNEKLDRMQALKLYTTNAAKVTNWENIRGMIYPGYNADFICLQENPLTCPINDLENITVIETWVNGNLVFSK